MISLQIGLNPTHGLGWLMASDSEAELAGILAHEIAHVAARHAARIQRRLRIWRLAALCSGPADFAMQFAGFLSSLKLTRDAEREAARAGKEINRWGGA